MNKYVETLLERTRLAKEAEKKLRAEHPKRAKKQKKDWRERQVSFKSAGQGAAGGRTKTTWVPVSAASRRGGAGAAAGRESAVDLLKKGEGDYESLSPRAKAVRGLRHARKNITGNVGQATQSAGETGDTLANVPKSKSGRGARRVRRGRGDPLHYQATAEIRPRTSQKNDWTEYQRIGRILAEEKPQRERDRWNPDAGEDPGAARAAETGSGSGGRPGKAFWDEARLERRRKRAAARKKRAAARKK